MPASPSGYSHLRALLLLATVASISSAVTSDQGSRFTVINCSSVAPSPAPAPSPLWSSSSTNSSFWPNVVTLLDELPSAAALTGFASLSRGNGTDRAFVRGLCSGDSTPANCAMYLQNAALTIRRSSCNSSRRAGIWYDDGSGGTVPAPMLCFLSFADTNASTAYEEAYRQPFQNIANLSDIGAWAYFTLMSSLAARVLNGSTSPPMFATGQFLYDPNARNGTLYGLVQCIRDRTATQCNQCLQVSMQQLPKCCYGRRGGTVLAYNCYMRMEVYPFYDLALDAAPSRERPAGKKGIVVILVVALPLGVVLGAVTIILVVFRYKWKSKQKITLPDNSDSEEDMSHIELDQLNLPILTDATNNFAKDNKLGEGGFGEVFKGILPGGEVIAVKRLSKHSSQGFHELKNELVLVAKLKHRNLVRLMGVCLKEEKLLVYEYMPNRSLDTILFDPVKRQQLDWSKRFMIICGIARGLLYLHEESSVKVIHRDLKPSNVLLDADLNPKISDFGLARAFIRDQSRDVTIRPVGTLGYMSPEYAYFGHVSNKSDMFSFGVIILEIVTGRRSNNSISECPDSTPLLNYMWGKWRTGLAPDVVDASLSTRGQYPGSEVLNCIEIGLLCVQENPDDRPDASTVVLMLNSPSTMSNGGRRVPSRPAFFYGRDNSTTVGAFLDGSEQPSTIMPVSKNEVTISEFQPR